MTVAEARRALIREMGTRLDVPAERASVLVDAFFVLLADAVRAGVQAENPKPSILPDDERKAALIRQMYEQKRRVEE